MRAPQPEYFRKPFSELSSRQRVSLIAHVAICTPILICFFAVPWVGVYLLLTGDVVNGVMTTVAGALLYLLGHTLNRI